MATVNIRVGISGWRYKGWRGIFYPPKLQQRRELEYASRQFPTIELNGSFYSLQRPQSFAQWTDATPDDFVFAVKGSRFITHMLRLQNVEDALANFFAQGLLQMGPKQGPFLWQLPPNFKYEPDRLKAFFKLLPRTARQAAKIARGHDKKLDGRAITSVPADAPLRHCLEIRNETFAAPEFIDLLRQHNIGLVVADTVEWPLLMDVTADFVYCRLHGSEQLYASGYDDDALDLWADRIVAWAAGGNSSDGRFAHPEHPPQSAPREVFVYFDNDAKVRAPFDALNLRERVLKRLPTASVL